MCGASFGTASWIDLERRWIVNQRRGSRGRKIDVGMLEEAVVEYVWMYGGDEGGNVERAVVDARLEVQDLVVVNETQLAEGRW